MARTVSTETGTWNVRIEKTARRVTERLLAASLHAATTGEG